MHFPASGFSWILTWLWWKPGNPTLKMCGVMSGHLSASRRQIRRWSLLPGPSILSKSALNFSKLIKRIWQSGYSIFPPSFFLIWGFNRNLSKEKYICIHCSSAFGGLSWPPPPPPPPVFILPVSWLHGTAESWCWAFPRVMQKLYLRRKLRHVRPPELSNPNAAESALEFITDHKQKNPCSTAGVCRATGARARTRRHARAAHVELFKWAFTMFSVFECQGNVFHSSFLHRIPCNAGQRSSLPAADSAFACMWKPAHLRTDFHRLDLILKSHERRSPHDCTSQSREPPEKKKKKTAQRLWTATWFDGAAGKQQSGSKETDWPFCPTSSGWKRCHHYKPTGRNQLHLLNYIH